MIKTEVFRFSEKVRLGLLNRPFGFQAEIRFVFPKTFLIFTSFKLVS